MSNSLMRDGAAFASADAGVPLSQAIDLIASQSELSAMDAWKSRMAGERFYFYQVRLFQENEMFCEAAAVCRYGPTGHLYQDWRTLEPVYLGALSATQACAARLNTAFAYGDLVLSYTLVKPGSLPLDVDVGEWRDYAIAVAALGGKFPKPILNPLSSAVVCRRGVQKPVWMQRGAVRPESLKVRAVVRLPERRAEEAAGEPAAIAPEPKRKAGRPSLNDGLVEELARAVIAGTYTCAYAAARASQHRIEGGGVLKEKIKTVADKVNARKKAILLAASSTGKIINPDEPR